MLLATAIIWQIVYPTVYMQYAIADGIAPFQPGFFAKEATFLHVWAALLILFFTCLWSIKLSFLLFFRRLGHNVRGHKIWWWCVLGATIATWATCVGDVQFDCSLNSLDWIYSKFDLFAELYGHYLYLLAHCTSEGSIRFEARTFRANCAVDIITDCLSE